MLHGVKSLIVAIVGYLVFINPTTKMHSHISPRGRCFRGTSIYQVLIHLVEYMFEGTVISIPTVSDSA
ncbi:hypothetical protein M7I_1718 [Glarea lozoyensis 74030]|uniref:Uncharacterized protein n=1 Tax=Glarea lozoyensis (strain ATCC 74030 / MF5533) TaxID=1104152 RepID=H0EGY7_GLAL7|nr:hypothetical protein M7I_1718 [Glarea lozoyensis 74030]